MTSSDIAYQPLSLAQHFEAEKGYSGHFGLICGYSADALFLCDAAERFTRLTRSQRAQQGQVSLAVMLDSGNSPISLLDTPGVAHLPMTDHQGRPFRLLHAKVALLGFRHQEEHSEWQLRLLVSTGNWTRQTLEDSLDLCWRVDLPSSSLFHPNEDALQKCADIRAANDLLKWIGSLFDSRLLKASYDGRNTQTMNAITDVNQWLHACSAKAQGKSRLFDNRNESFLSQLPKMISANNDVKRNYLAMGSGFYESSGNPQEPPEVPLAIIKILQEGSLLTRQPEVDLFVNPNACQSVATTREGLQGNGVVVRPAATPHPLFAQGQQRSLHAKFLFSANYRDSSNTCASPWVYLGSGNLTKPGFANSMSRAAGNLEAGVVFIPATLFWRKSRDIRENLVLTNLLPIQWEVKCGDKTTLLSGSDLEQRDCIFLASPIAWLAWHDEAGIRELRAVDSTNIDVEVLNSEGVPCARTKTGFSWIGAQPRDVCIRWIADTKLVEARIPIVDQYGRIAATALSPIDFDEAWWQLADFPAPADSEANQWCEEPDSGIERVARAAGAQTLTTSYPIRQMMNLMESIAAKQVELHRSDWALWCNRLEQTLGQAGESAPVEYFRDKLKLNPLSALRHRSFRPLFAESTASELGKLYDDSLDRIEAHWRVQDLSPIGEAK
jgi:hypothetical protein